MTKLYSMIKKLIPVSSPLITTNDAKNVYKVVKSGWVSSSGKEIIEFEKKLAKFVNRKFACTVSSGTAALEIAVKSLGKFCRENEIERLKCSEDSRKLDSIKHFCF